MSFAAAAAPWWGTAVIGAAAGVLGVLLSLAVEERRRRRDRAFRYHEPLLEHGVAFIRQIEAIEDRGIDESRDELTSLFDRLDDSYRFLQVVAPPGIVNAASECKRHAKDKKRRDTADGAAGSAKDDEALAHSRVAFTNELRKEFGVDGQLSRQSARPT